jgi:CrcB protein
LTLEPLLVGVGGALGATARYGVGVVVRSEVRIPVSTLLVNVAGSFVLGLVAFGATEGIFALVGTGACGAFTTFSSFSYETVEALRDDPPAGVANAVLNLVLCVSAVGLASLVT